MTRCAHGKRKRRTDLDHCRINVGNRLISKAQSGSLHLTILASYRGSFGHYLVAPKPQWCRSVLIHRACKQTTRYLSCSAYDGYCMGETCASPNFVRFHPEKKIRQTHISHCCSALSKQQISPSGHVVFFDQIRLALHDIDEYALNAPACRLA